MEVVDQTPITKRILTKSIARRVASNFGWSVVSVAIARGVFFVTNIYLARTLGVSNFGLFALAQTITYYFWLAVDLGTNMYGIREIARNKENAEEIINPLLTLRITAGFVVFSICTLFLFLLDISIMKRLTFVGCSLYLITYAFYSEWILKGLEKFKYIAFGSFVSSLTFLICTIYFVKGNDDLITASFIWSLSYFLGSISLLYFLYKRLSIKYTPSFNFKIWFSHVKESIYFTISGSLMVFHQYLPILMLSIFFTSYEVGLFSAPYRTTNSICNLGFLLPMAFYPILSDSYLNDLSAFSKANKLLFKIMFVIGFCMSLSGMIYSSDIITFLFGHEYMESIKAFKLLIWLVLIIFVRYSIGIAILSMGLQRWQALSSGIALGSNIILGLLLIPKYSIEGATISLLGAEGISLGMLIFIFVIKGRYRTNKK